MMKKWSVTATVTGSKFLGIFEAETKEEAEQMAEESESGSISLCNQCSDKCEDPMINDVEAEEVPCQ
jgi:hypothetical protein